MLNKLYNQLTLNNLIKRLHNHRDIFMNHLLKKDGHLLIPIRDPLIIAIPKPTQTEKHKEQILKAINHGFTKYQTTLEKLSKV